MSDFTTVVDPSLPLPQILVRGKTGLQAYVGPFIQTSSEHTVTTSGVYDGLENLRSSPIYSPDGRFLAVIYETKNLSIYNSTSGDLLIELPISDSQKVEFSPKSTFIITWSRPTKGSANDEADGNFRVWSIASGTIVTSFSLKAYKSDVLQWTSDESYCFHLVTNEIHILHGLNLTEGILEKVRHKGLVSFKISPTSTPHVSIAVFNPEAGGKPAKVSLYKYKGVGQVVEGPLSSRTIFSANEANLLWNSTGSALLIHSHSDVDSSNTSYYGSTGLYLMIAGSDVSSKVEQSKEGPIHDVQWSPNGDRFVVAAGAMPSHSTLYNATGEPVYQFGAAHRNTISWSPHGRFLCLAGFGNLAGEMDFYDILRLKKLGSNISHCSISYSWSPDSRYFLTASLAPRMNVDNGFRVFKYNGIGPVVNQPIERAYDTLFRPAAAGVYPNRPPSPKRPIAGTDCSGYEKATTPSALLSAPATASNVPVKAAPYRPPGSRGDLSNFMNRETGPAVGKIKKDVTGNVKPAAYVPPVQKARVIVGMAPAAVTAGHKKPVGAGQPVAKPVAKPTPAVTAPKAVAPVTNPKVVTSMPLPSPGPVKLSAEEAAQEKEKRVKNLRKKLKQLDEIKTKKASGQALEPEQVKKLETEASLLAELQELA